MIQSKHSREFNSSEEASKRQKLSKNYGIFVSGIPNRVSLKRIIDGFADDSFFVPMYRKKNIHIAYFLFETESERDNKYMTIFNIVGFLRRRNASSTYQTIHNMINYATNSKVDTIS